MEGDVVQTRRETGAREEKVEAAKNQAQAGVMKAINKTSHIVLAIIR
jgi:hypothetical protein